MHPAAYLANLIALLMHIYNFNEYINTQIKEFHICFPYVHNFWSTEIIIGEEFM